MALITDILTGIDTATAGVLTGATFNALASAVNLVVRLGATLLVAFFGINMLVQIIPVSPGAAMMTGLRVGLVLAFFNSWANFSLVYEALTNTPAEVGAAVLSGFGIEHEGNLYDGLDDVYGKVLEVSNSIAEGGGYVSGAISALAVFLIAALMATVAVFVLGIAKIGLAVFGVIAPAMIACALFRPTAPIFEAWIKQAITFSFIPLLVTVVSGVVLMLFDFAAPGSLAGISTLGEAISFVVVAMVGTGLLLQVPSMAGSFGQTMVAVGAVAANAYANSKALPGRSRAGAAVAAEMAKSGAGVAAKGVGLATAPATGGASVGAGLMMKGATSGAASVARGLSAAETRKAALK